MIDKKVKYFFRPVLLAFYSVAIGVSLSTPLSALASEQVCNGEIHVACGKTPSTALIDGNSSATPTMLVVFVQNGRIYFTESNDLGKSYTTPIAINPVAENIYADGENRPKIVVGKQDEIYISWTKKTDGRYTGDIQFSRSLDKGKSFSKPVVINNDGLLTGHRFDTLAISKSGKLYISWLDKRDQHAAKKNGTSYKGSAIYYAVSDSSGENFLDSKNLKNYRVANGSCECCRIAMTESGQDNIAVLWRHIFDTNTRDHAYAILEPDGSSTMGRATVDNWNINACPHHGPDLTMNKSEAANDQYHMTWFSNGNNHKGIYYGLHNFTDNDASQIYSVDSDTGASHPQIVSIESKDDNVKETTLFIAWKHFDGKESHIKLIESADNGVNWTEATSIMKTANNSDHPQLLTYGPKAFLAWHTEAEGYRVSPIN